jgi:hypothetical protein
MEKLNLNFVLNFFVKNAFLVMLQKPKMDAPKAAGVVQMEMDKKDAPKDSSHPAPNDPAQAAASAPPPKQ